MHPSRKDYDRARRRALSVLEPPPASADAAVETFLAASADVLDIVGSCWHHTDPSTGLPVTLAAAGDPAGSFQESLQYEFRRPDVARFAELRTRRLPLTTISAETEGQMSRSRRFREMIEPTGTADELRVAFRDAFGTWSALVVFTARRLGEDDLRFVGELLPAATAALRAGVAAELRPVPAAEPRPGMAAKPRQTNAPVAPAGDHGGPSVVLLDPADRVIAAGAAARRRLALLPNAPDGQVPGLLACLAAQVRWDQDSPSASARMRTPDGTWLLADASRLDDGADDCVAVVLQPAPSSAVLDSVLRSLALSAREREIAALVVQGHSTKAIATSLVLSPWTVQDHLKAIYEKTGVGGRYELAGLAPAS
ncbi:MAG: helix-turn-helix transcriptional regulator [Solirubrobacterales bacterium]|nr:helix-turn-helix transcriptional regulator [Solirubrobacterales bacterium]